MGNDEEGHLVGVMDIMLLLNYYYKRHGAEKYRIVSAKNELDKYLGHKDAMEYRHRFISYSSGG